jgi:hypothetical protein
MSVRLSIACSLLTALFLRASVVQAKPPDLPALMPVICAPFTPVNSNPAAPALLEDEEPADTHTQARVEGTRRTLTRCVLFVAHPLLALLPLEEFFAADEDESPAKIDASSLNGSKPNPNFVRDSSCQMPNEMHGNLEKLRSAEKAYRQAESDRRRGQFDRAATWYAEVRHLCPGSRYDWMAEARLRQLAVENPSAPTDLGAEEEEAGPPPSPGGACPYLQNKKKGGHPAVPGTFVAAASPLENLDKLEQAEQLCHEAESLCRDGHTGEAIATYEAIRRLCPGSRYEEMASNRLRALHRDGAMKEEVAETGTEELRQRLRSPINLAVTDMPLVRVLDELRVLTPHGLSIKVDQSAIEAAGINLDRPITMILEQVSVKSVLVLLLQGTDLVYCIKDGAVLITTPARTGEPVTTLRYPVADLFSPQAAPVMAAFQKEPCKRIEGLESMSPLCRVIVQLTDGPNWSSRIGSGTMAFDPKFQELVVTQTAEMHRQVGEALAVLRRLIEAECPKSSEEESSPPSGKDQSSAPTKLHSVPALLGGCQRALNAGDFAKAGLLIKIDEASGEEQEAPTRSPEETLLFVKPAPTELFLAEEEPTGMDFLASLVLEWLKPGNCLELHLSHEGGRGRFQLDLGGAGLRLTWERNAGPSLLIWSYGGSETGADR